MTPPDITYTIESPDAAQNALAGLRERFDTRNASRESCTRTYHDTFDWRLYRQDGVLCSLARRDDWMLQWQGLDGSLRGRSIARVVPEFASDLPEELAGELGRFIEMRRLLPVARVDLHAEVVSVLDRRQKTVARVHLERGTASTGDTGSPSHPIHDRLRAAGIRGYEAQLGAVLAFLDDRDDLTRQKTGEFDQVLAAMGKQPCSYSSKLDLGLEPDARADESAKVILDALLRTMRANEDGTRRDLDTEFLHDFRVSVRRTRSCLGQLKGLFPEKITERYRREFAWLGNITGPTRDLDVYLMNMVDYRTRLPAGLCDDLDPLERYLRERQKKEQQRLARELGSARYRKLIRDWSEFLNAAVPREEQDGATLTGTRPISEVAAERVRRAFRRVCKRGGEVNEQTPVEVLHRLRIDCKKLRYLLEFFRSLYEADRIAPLIRSLKRLQDDLGDFNDVGVQTAEMKATAGEMLEKQIATTDTLLAMGCLMGQIEERGRSLKNRVIGSVGEFVGNDVRANFRRLLP